MKPKINYLLSAALAVFMTASAVQAQSTFYFSGTASSYISMGETELINSANGTIVFNNGYSYDHGLHLNMTTTAGENWSLDVGAIDRGQLQVGLYTNATRFPFNNGSSPGLNFKGNGREDNTLTGWFNVLSVTYSNSTLVAAAVDFVQYDTGNPADETSGYVRYNSTTSLGPDFTSVRLTNNAINFAWVAGPGQVFQMQYCTNFPSTNWFNLGAAITNGNAGATLTDSSLTDHQRFYRVKRLLP